MMEKSQGQQLIKKIFDPIVIDKPVIINWTLIKQYFGLDPSDFETLKIDQINQDQTLDFHLSNFSDYQNYYANQDQNLIIDHYLQLVNSLVTAWSYQWNDQALNQAISSLNQSWIAKADLIDLKDPIDFYYQIYIPYFYRYYDLLVNQNRDFYASHYQLANVYLQPGANFDNLVNFYNQYLKVLPTLDQSRINFLKFQNRQTFFKVLNQFFAINLSENQNFQSATLSDFYYQLQQLTTNKSTKMQRSY